MTAASAKYNIKVFCRFRPVIQTETSSCNKDMATFPKDNTVIIEGTSYVFDGVFPPETYQEQVYNTCAKQIVKDVLEGCNGTIFAYGQTSSGKTHSMEGNLNDLQHMGIIPRIAKDIFNHVNDNLEFHIKVSYFEIYMEKINDLLDVTKTNLCVHEDENHVPYVKGCTERFVSSPEEITNIINEGKSKRHVAGTNMNEYSSRSHSIFQIVISQEHGDHKLSGKLYLVDLAGSEKVSKTGAVGNVLDEAKNINKSLSALCNVVSALTERAKTHIPYRDSKLTRVLQDFLGGNCRTTILICCSPSSLNKSETMYTLMFGQRAKRIKNTASINHKMTSNEWQRKYEKEKEKNNILENKIQTLEMERRNWHNGTNSPECKIGESRRKALFFSFSTDRLSHKCCSVATMAASEWPMAQTACLMAWRAKSVVWPLGQSLTSVVVPQQVSLLLESMLGNSDTMLTQLGHLQTESESTKTEVQKFLQALEELMVSYDQKNQNGEENSLINNKQLTEQLRNKMASLMDLEVEFAQIHEVISQQRKHISDMLNRQMKDLNKFNTILVNGEITLMEEMSGAIEELTVVQQNNHKIESEVKSMVEHCGQQENMQLECNNNMEETRQNLPSCSMPDAISQEVDH
ncbi:kinesin heavy chain-like [Sinocyclocheilus rhinocerous]|uniref:kinesin heavy chain-like n=1 Tax=Sinocyclocheilus rhinocerous TaxID=307959 RepID=UPI0007B8B955|nr:PREDICTED: kinesin heavy chain-like [Sinocyclocheilus rhinocerous]